MANIDQYIQAATRENTRRSYQSDITHFEVSWGGFLPATADSIAKYLADHAEALSIGTLRQRKTGYVYAPVPTETASARAPLSGCTLGPAGKSVGFSHFACNQLI